MTVIYKGLDCVKDKKNPLYATYETISQSGVHSWSYQQNYANYTLYFGACLIAVFVLRNLTYRYYDWTSRNARIEGRKQGKFFHLLNKVVALSRYISYKRFPLVLSRITGLPPSFGTLIVFAASTLYIFCFLFIPHFWYRACRGFGSPPLAVRAGLMVMGLTPFLFILAGKTNFISQVTGIGYEKLNVYHQAIGWGSLFLSLVHTIPFFVQHLREGGSEQVHYYWSNELIYRNGVPPLVLLTVLCFMSLRAFRNNFYEIFLHSHWILAVAYIVLLGWHIYGSLNSEKYLWATIGFWGFQVLYRLLVKTTFFKPTVYALKSKRADLKLLPNDLYEITVKFRTPDELNWSPGQHVFIRFLYGLHTLDNHPFSILTIPKLGDSELKLLVKPQNGLTGKLYKNLSDESKSKQYKTFIDGPYGGVPRDPLSFDKLILVSSGSGVTVTYPFLEYVARRITGITTCTKSIDFIWVISDVNSLDWIKKELTETIKTLKSISEKLMPSFNIEIFVTNSKIGTPTIITDRSQLIQEATSSSDGNTVNSMEKQNKLETFESCDQEIKIFMNQKPNVRQYLNSDLLLPGKNAIVCSGTGSLQIEVGNAASELQREVMKTNSDVHEVYLHTENFGW